jgi:DNA primase
MRYQPEFLDELRRRVALSALISRRVKLQRHGGGEYSGLCPFHSEKTPSFFVVDDQRFFYCFGCGAHGDAISFLMATEGLDFRAAVARLGGELGAAVAAPLAGNSPPPAPIARREKHERNRWIALRLWQDAGPARGTPVE